MGHHKEEKRGGVFPTLSINAIQLRSKKAFHGEGGDVFRTEMGLCGGIFSKGGGRLPFLADENISN